MKHLTYQNQDVVLVRERNGIAELFTQACEILHVPQAELDYSTLRMVEKPLVPGSPLLPDRPSDWLTKWRARRLELIAQNIKVRKNEKSKQEPGAPKPRSPRKASPPDLVAKANEMLRMKLLAAQQQNGA